MGRYVIYLHMILASKLVERQLLMDLVLLAFIICGGLAFELLRVVPEIWSLVTSMFSRVKG